MTGLLSAHNAQVLDAFLEVLYLEKGLSDNTLSAYQTDLRQLCRF